MTFLTDLRWSDRAWFYLVASFVALSAADLGMTLRLVDLGAVELNPVMASVLDAGWAWATVFKGSITFGVTTGLWFGRRHRIVRQTGAAFVAVLVAVTIYQLVNLWAS